jgi:hypothetical protein
MSILKQVAIGTRPGLRGLVGTLCGAGIVTLVALCFSAVPAWAPICLPGTCIDEVLTFEGAVFPHGGQSLTSFDMSFVDPTLGLYLLADRDVAGIDVLPTGTLSPTPSQLGAGQFVGFTGAENTSGPNGVITANNHTEVWAGDGPDPTTSTSHVVVINIASNAVTRIDTGGLQRAAKLCEDPKDNVVLVANDGPADRFLSFISTKKHTVSGKITLDGTDPNGNFLSATNATSAIGQCQWISSTGSFYVAVPEVGGSGDNSAPGAVLVIDPKKMKVQQVFDVDHTQCVGPQGMAIGPNPQMLLGCSGVGAAPYAEPVSITAPGSVIINGNDGSRLFSLPGLNGVDEVWYNPTDNSYFLAANNNTLDSSGTATLTPQIAVVDAGPPETATLDQSVLTGDPTAHSIAVDPSAKIVYSPSTLSSIAFGFNGFIGLYEAVIVDDPPVVVGGKNK